MRRFSETRRPHPLGEGVSIAEGIRAERRRMAPIRRLADVVIDTTKFNVHELRQFVMRTLPEPAQQPLLISVVSFGFRYGIPSDADLVFDVRFLPNPHFVPRLRPFSGKDPKVARYIRSFPQTESISSPHRKPAGLSDPALHSRRQKLFDGRTRMHGRAAPFGDAGRSDCAAISSGGGTPPKSFTAIWKSREREPRGLCGGRVARYYLPSQSS